MTQDKPDRRNRDMVLVHWLEPGCLHQARSTRPCRQGLTGASYLPREMASGHPARPRRLRPAGWVWRAPRCWEALEEKRGTSQGRLLA